MVENAVVASVVHTVETDVHEILQTFQAHLLVVVRQRGRCVIQ